jgi:hypothetical protein
MRADEYGESVLPAQIDKPPAETEEAKLIVGQPRWQCLVFQL